MYKYPENIFDATRQDINNFLNQDIDIAGFTFNQYKNVQKIHKYYNSKYNDGDYETVNGVKRKRVFWNIGKRRATIASKQIENDTKDFILIPKQPKTEWIVNILEKELKAEMQKFKFSKILNQVADELPVYGSVVLRKTQELAELVDLRYLFSDPSAKSLKDARYIIIKHLLTPEQMRKMTAWNNTQEAIEKFTTGSTVSYEQDGLLNLQGGSPIITVYERFAEVPRSYINNQGALNGKKDDDEYVYARFIMSGVDASYMGDDGKARYHDGIIHFMEEVNINELPFKEVHYRKTIGRWQGIGVIEDLFEDQRMINKIKDQEDKATELASLILFQMQEDTTIRSIATDVSNGDFIKSKTPINRLDNSNRALNDMQVIAGSYETHADRETFSADMLGGEQAPATATLGAVNAQLQSSASVYDYKKENIGIFLNEFITDLVFPDIEKNIKKAHLYNYAGDMQELRKMREQLIDGYIREKVFAMEMDIPSQEEEQILKNEWLAQFAKKGSTIWLDIIDSFFKNVEYELSLEITGEGKNVQQWLTNLQGLLGMVSKNPQLLENPVLKRILFHIMSAMGMSTSELENLESEVTDKSNQQQAQQAPMQQQLPQQIMQ